MSEAAGTIETEGAGVVSPPGTASTRKSKKKPGTTSRQETEADVEEVKMSSLMASKELERELQRLVPDVRSP
jgi:hypothetical protein